MALAQRQTGILNRVGQTWLTLRHDLPLLSLALAGLAFNVIFGLANDSRVDFNEFYAAGKLVGSGHLYDWNAIRTLELQHARTAVPCVRIPAFALAFKPISWLPYGAAHALWLGIGIAALIAFAALWPFSNRARACVAACWSMPAALCLGFGQDSTLFLFFVTAGVKLLLSGQEFWAGAVFSLGVGKSHCALLLPVFLAAKGKWKALLGGLTGGIVIVSVSFAAEGKQWPARLLSLMSIPEVDPAANRMPNLRGLLHMVGGGWPLELALALAVTVTTWFLIRHGSLPFGASLALAGGLLLSHHAYGYDAVLLLPALLLAFELPNFSWLRLWAVALFSPIPYYLLMNPKTDTDWAGHLIISGYTLALITALTWTQWRQRILRGTVAAGGLR
jgi:hypothetical protein